MVGAWRAYEDTQDGEDAMKNGTPSEVPLSAKRSFANLLRHGAFTTAA